jgi:hypothetical protein
MSTCADALSNVQRITNDNRRSQEEHNNKRRNYELSVNKQREWDKCKNNLDCGGEYDRFAGRVRDLRNEKKHMINCIDWISLTRNDYGGYCRNDHGDGWKHVDNTNGGCTPGWGKGVCARNDDRIKQDLGIGNRPGTETDPGNFVPLPVPEIKCCQEIAFKNISADKVAFDNISQSCNVVGTSSKNESNTSKEESDIISQIESNSKNFKIRSATIITILILAVASVMIVVFVL